MTSRWRDLVAEGYTWLVPGEGGISGKPLSLLVGYRLLHEEHVVLRLIPAHAVGCFDYFSKETQFLVILTQINLRDMHVTAPHLPHKKELKRNLWVDLWWASFPSTGKEFKERNLTLIYMYVFLQTSGGTVRLPGVIIWPCLPIMVSAVPTKKCISDLMGKLASLLVGWRQARDPQETNWACQVWTTTPELVRVVTHEGRELENHVWAEHPCFCKPGICSCLERDLVPGMLYSR